MLQISTVCQENYTILQLTQFLFKSEIVEGSHEM